MDAGKPRRVDRRLTLFDLDNTLIGGDSDYGWAQFLIDQGALDRDTYERRNAEFFEDYKAARLDIYAFLDFQLRPLAENTTEQLLAWRDQFLGEKIRPLLLAAAKDVVDECLAAGDLVAVVTATNSFVTRPIAAMYGIVNLVATEPEIIDGRFTGRVSGEPCFQEGKVRRVDAWLASLALRREDFAESAFYSDSRNDLSLLSAVTRPVAVDPDATLAAHAAAHGWPIVSWRAVAA
jgi:HAD superfamily hydrolase (TIGR01490 family)